jgi:hypothetical protein
MTDHNDKPLKKDELLDSLLSAYSDVEPGPGLENRVLANLRDAESRKASWSWSLGWLWAGAAAVVALIVAALIAGGHRPAAQPGKTAVQTHAPGAPIVGQPLVQHGLPVTAAARSRRRTMLRASTPAHAQDATLALNQRPPFFPTPVALSEQERLMFAYLASTPREEVIAEIQRNDQKEAEAFWEAQPFMAGQRSGNTR